MLTTKAPIKGVEINIVRGRGKGGKGCIVKRMRNFARAFAKVTENFLPGLELLISIVLSVDSS